jgi:hypothetical protein
VNTTPFASFNALHGQVQSCGDITGTGIPSLGTDGPVKLLPNGAASIVVFCGVAA